MKKMLTICFALMAAVVMNAETTTTLWTGSDTAAWDNRINIPCDWTTVSEGDVLTFTAVTEGNAEKWASFHLLSAAWNKVVTDLSFPYEEGATKTCTFTMTAVALDSALNAGGLGVQGLGFTLKKIEITPLGTSLDGVSVSSEHTLDSLGIRGSGTVRFELGIKESAVHRGGINLFGKNFGDFPQAIVMKLR